MKIFYIFSVISVFLGISCENPGTRINISGEAQGTTYNISYYDHTGRNLNHSIDSILKEFDKSLSIYDNQSLVTKINNNEETFADHYLKTVFLKSKEISEQTEGAFDVTAGSLYNIWGFGNTPRLKTDSSVIKEILSIIGYTKVRLEGDKIIKDHPQIKLNFNAIAQGYSVDVISDFLQLKGIKNYLVEIGGEVRASGHKENGEEWKVGIDKPVEDLSERVLQTVIELNNKSLATSGNYRKFYEENGQKFSHTIDPRTGYPVKNNLLSATVIAADCMTADAFATAFMVMGVEETINFFKRNKDKYPLEIYLIYNVKGEFATYSSEGW